MAFRLTLALLLLVAAAGRATATDVTACGQSIAARDTGVLTVDLTCSSSVDGAILGEKSTLDLNGHTLSGSGVYCTTSCTVKGPGTITNVHYDPGANATAIFANFQGSRRTKFVAENIDLHDNDNGIVSQAARVTLSGVNASNNDQNGIHTLGARIVRGTNVTASNNGASGLSVDSNGTVRLTGFTAMGNGWGGVINDGKRTVLVGSTVTGNAWPPFPGEPSMVDIATAAGRCPRLTSTTCDHSFPNCHVCSGD
jgi:hypothetical protein